MFVAIHPQKILVGMKRLVVFKQSRILVHHFVPQSKVLCT